jgi:hypothetical protein
MHRQNDTKTGALVQIGVKKAPLIGVLEIFQALTIFFTRPTPSFDSISTARNSSEPLARPNAPGRRAPSASTIIAPCLTTRPFLNTRSCPPPPPPARCAPAFTS